MRIVPVIICGLLAATLAGCATKQPVYDGQVAAFSIDHFDNAPKAVYANQIPLYPGAKLTDAMGSESWGDTPDSYSKGMGWTFSYQAPMGRVIAFYDAALPDAQRSTDSGSGSVTWRLVPRGAQSGEYVEVRLKDGELWLHEEYRPRGSGS